MKKEAIKKNVREAYGKAAKAASESGGSSCCGPSEPCGGDATGEFAKSIGYTDSELSGVPEGANLGLGCGNPTALASLNEGEVVVDLGSGAGFDCFIAGKHVGESGRVIGVDMTHEMIEKARGNAEKSGAGNVEFRLGEIENLPVADNSVDVVISNCVINLSVDKPRVFSEIHRILKPGGRVAISDIVLLEDLPEEVLTSVEAYVGCVSGAVYSEEYEGMINDAGFSKVRITKNEYSTCCEPGSNDPITGAIKEAGIDVAGKIASIYVEAKK